MLLSLLIIIKMNIFSSIQLGEVEVSNTTLTVLILVSSFTFIAVGISSFKLYRSLLNNENK